VNKLLMSDPAPRFRIKRNQCVVS